MKRQNETIQPSQQRFVKVGECLYRHKSSKVYYALVKRSGKQFRKSLSTTDREIASRKLRELRSKIGRIRNPRTKRKTSFVEVADSWLASFKPFLKRMSLRRRITAIKSLKEHFGQMPVTVIHPTDCEAWASKRGATVSASTFNKERDALIAILAYAETNDILPDNPARHLSRRKPDQMRRLIIPSRDQFSTLVRILRVRDRRCQDAADLCELLACSGMRLGEAISLCWTDIDFENKRVTITGGEEGTKNREVRVLPLFPALDSLLRRIRQRSPEQRTSRARSCVQPADASPVTESASHQTTSEPVVAIVTAKRAIASACKEGQLPEFTHHSFRHYFCSNAIEAGVDFKTIAAWLGHKDGGILVAKTYGHLRDTHAAEMAKRMVFEA